MSLTPWRSPFPAGLIIVQTGLKSQTGVIMVRFTNPSFLQPYKIMNINEPTKGRIFIGGRGAGGVSKEDIERRARQLADIDGRSGPGITDRDLARAEAELMGLVLPATSVEDEEADGAMTRDPSEPLSIKGHEIPLREGPDEEKAVERLALEGVEEAQHEQMLAARREARRSDESAGS